MHIPKIIYLMAASQGHGNHLNIEKINDEKRNRGSEDGTTLWRITKSYDLNPGEQGPVLKLYGFTFCDPLRVNVDLQLILLRLVHAHIRPYLPGTIDIVPLHASFEVFAEVSLCHRLFT